MEADVLTSSAGHVTGSEKVMIDLSSNWSINRLIASFGVAASTTGRGDVALKG